jgi:hypothetical protein
MPGEAYTRVSAIGVLGSVPAPYEIFSYSFAIKHGGDALTALQQVAIGDAVSAFHGRQASRMAPQAVLTQVAFAHKSALGPQDQPTVRLPKATNGGLVGTVLPPQVTVAVSLRGPLAVSPIRGRFYIPLPIITLNPNNGLGDEGHIQSLADSALQLINEVNAAGADLQVGIAHKTGVAPVTEIRVGRALDTLRSRRNAIKEDYRLSVGALVP